MNTLYAKLSPHKWPKAQKKKIKKNTVLKKLLLCFDTLKSSYENSKSESV